MNEVPGLTVNCWKSVGQVACIFPLKGPVNSRLHVFPINGECKLFVTVRVSLGDPPGGKDEEVGLTASVTLTDALAETRANEAEAIIRSMAAMTEIRNPFFSGLYPMFCMDFSQNGFHSKVLPQRQNEESRR